MKRTILHLLISLFLVQFLVSNNLAALELNCSNGRSIEIGALLLLELSCDFTECSLKSDGLVWNRIPCFSSSQDYTEKLFTPIALSRSHSIHHPVLSLYKGICHLRL